MIFPNVTNPKKRMRGYFQINGPILMQNIDCSILYSQNGDRSIKNQESIVEESHLNPQPSRSPKIVRTLLLGLLHILGDGNLQLLDVE
jgi:hypothetical protein